MGAEYEGDFTELIGKWNLALRGSYDEKLKYYFFGVGNETLFDKEKLYYEWFSKEIHTSIGLNRILKLHHQISISGFYRGIRAEKDTGTYLIQKLPNNDTGIFNNQNFIGANAIYKYHKLNNEVLPTKGIDFMAAASYTQNLKISNRQVGHYETMFGFYLPFSKSISIAMRTGAATLTGTPEFYQLNMIGGGATLRGYNRQRFFGKTSFYNGTDLRWFFKTRNYLFNGTLGLIAFFDNGRVWQPGEDSNKWHTGYGGGFLISPFNKLAVTIYYGVSEETNRFHIRLARLF